MSFAAALSHVRSLARRFILVTTFGISILCGLLAVAFHRYVELTRSLQSLVPLLDVLVPGQTRCNYLGLYFRNAGIPTYSLSACITYGPLR